MVGTVPEDDPGPSAASGGSRVRTDLRSGALKLPAVVMQGIAHTAPATAVLLTLPFIASHAGVVAPLAYLLAFLIVLMLGLVLTQHAKHIASAGGYYAYVSRTVHPRAGFLVSWLFVLYTATVPAFSLAKMGGVLESSLAGEYGLVVPWWLFLLVGTGFTFASTYRGIEVSAGALFVLGVLEMGIVVLLAVWGLIAPGSGGWNLSSFSPAHVADGTGFYLGVVFSIFALTGWEGVVPLAEESADPRRIVPRAIVGTILIIGVYLVFTSWGLLVGWGTRDVRTLIDSKEMPPLVLARRYWGPAWVLILFALTNSMLAVAVASSLVSTRMWYAMARCGSLPAPLGRVHPRFRTPVPAIALQTVMTLGVGLGLGLWIGPEQEFDLMGVVVTLALALIYSAGNLGVLLHYTRAGRSEFRPLLHGLLPLASTAAVLWVGYKSVVPPPPGTLAYAPMIVAVWLAVGIAVLVVARSIGREHWLLEGVAADPRSTSGGEGELPSGPRGRIEPDDGVRG
jgi:amino acid transporter